MTGPRDEEKLRRLHKEYLLGKTMKELAEENGVSRQAISFNFKRHGFDITGGGVAIKREHKKILIAQKLAARRDAKSMLGFGVSYEDSRKVSRKNRDKYRDQKKQAERRGIGWEMNMNEWVNVWDSVPGGLEARGRRVGQYVMARHGDVGPYKVGNVSIITCSQNIMDVRERERVARRNLVVAEKS